VAVRRRLDAELVRRGLLDSRERAADVIAHGRVLVSGSPAFVPGRLVGAGEPIRVADADPRFVSRGGDKLAAALEGFDLGVADARALDAGAAAGGFTDCLLQSGAAHVVAVDVARGQLAWTLRNDPRVTLLERTNIRGLVPDDIGGPVDVVVADLSFISLLSVAPALVRCSTSDAELVLLVKPQFEARRWQVGDHGIVRDPEVHRAVLRETRDGLFEHGLVVVDAIPSPLRGADGNSEFLFHGRKHGVLVDDALLDACVDRAFAQPGARR
jgi:23S rRNA (cytidine1920-2'-O)/16S rRNA (cytidine1409-2'-O)-methyltransferase